MAIKKAYRFPPCMKTRKTGLCFPKRSSLPGYSLSEKNSSSFLHRLPLLPSYHEYLQDQKRMYETAHAKDLLAHAVFPGIFPSNQFFVRYFRAVIKGYRSAIDKAAFFKNMFHNAIMGIGIHFYTVYRFGMA